MTCHILVKINVKKQTCAFWNKEALQWSTVGCRISHELSTKDETVCLCNHLTNFALLFDLNGDTHEKHENMALHIASYVLLSVSSVAIIAALLIQFKFQK